MRYKTVFQCPNTGHTVIARYAFGRVTLTAADDGVGDKETEQYCKDNTNHPASSIDAADDYIRTVSDGQSDGFDVY
jgi:hypothetical protein